MSRHPTIFHPRPNSNHKQTTGPPIFLLSSPPFIYHTHIASYKSTPPVNCCVPLSNDFPAHIQIQIQQPTVTSHYYSAIHFESRKSTMPSNRIPSRPRRAKSNPSEASVPKRLRRLTLHHNVKKTVSFAKGVKKNERIVLKKSEKEAKAKGKINFVFTAFHFNTFSKQNSYLVHLYI